MGVPNLVINLFLFFVIMLLYFVVVLFRRQLNSLALSRHTQLLEVLEIPQVMETCVRNGYYEEALDLNTHVRRLGKRHGNTPIIKVCTRQALVM